MNINTTYAKSSLEKSGDIMHLLLPASALGASLMVEDDYQGSWQLIQSGVVSRIAVEGLKFSVDKDRPDGSADDSFPSGHTADSFASATFIQQRYGWHWGVPAFIGATFVGYSRVNSDKHYVEDVLAGAVIGILSGLYFTEPYSGITISPTANTGHYGISVSGTF
ncbi:phosphatase PAP2 family protein [Colwellia ponticola]|uniref:undecaprenyl-diphosphate phosphatase n=1 Tax=Colwellia ponticola TaxID=2304625 RepID=A0A8H2PJC7_9GAMM|nr:phosphatase PAP2 family protein [Colwellia ponticola]TMM43105.1 phosphatase PAP2 family protein [Colwellia ponticola]